MSSQPTAQPAVKSEGRLDGLDLARFFAFFGMVLVNFKVVVAASTDAATSLPIAWLHQMIEGRAAALFVMLAGLGIGLGLKRAKSLRQVSSGLIKRGLVLFAFGLLNLLVFEADILHFYGLYFILAIIFLPLGTKGLMLAASGLIMLFPFAAILFDYDAGWDWDSLVYKDFWSVAGFLRHSFINGWHPVVPWLAFLLFGMALARFDLREKAIRWRMLAIGSLTVFVAWLIGLGAEALAALPELLSDKELIDLLPLLFSTEPLPPSPLYMFSASGAALVMIVLSLWLGDMFGKTVLIQPLAATGRQALTLYIAHILIGMGLLEAAGLVAEDASQATTSLAHITLLACLFTLAAILYVWVWQRFLGKGPLERLLRKLAG